MQKGFPVGIVCSCTLQLKVVMEVKFHDLNVDDGTIASGGTIVQGSCNLIAQGTGESERIGRKVHIVKLMWRYEIQLPDTTVAANTHDDVRLILYVDKQCNGAAAAVTDILASDNYQSFYKRSNKDRFVVLHDETTSLRASAGMATNGYGEVSFSDMLVVKLFIPIEFSGTDGLIGEIKSNNVGVLVCGGSGLAGLNSKMRVLYIDA